MTMVETSLAATLRAWRDRMTPTEAGLYAGRARRAVGLRREELAELAGVSVDYLVRLEQGRATAPSPEVVGSLARVLQLSRSERDHLYSLAGLQPPGDRVICNEITPSVQRLLGRLTDLAVAVFAADWTMLWWSRGWAALLGDPEKVAPEQRNFVLQRFPVAARVGCAAHWPMRIANLEASDRAIVADLRRASARYPEDRRLAELLRMLLEGNAQFAELWRAGAVAEHPGAHKIVEHPVVGEIAVDCDVLHASEGDLNIVTMTAVPGSEDARRLERAIAAL